MSDGPLRVAKLESFYLGGAPLPVDTPMHGGDEMIVGAMYVQHIAPAELSFPYPVVFIHGGMHTGVTWETTPDGRAGWQTLFVRAGFDTYVVDQPYRGRSAPDLTALAPSVPSSGPAPQVAVGGRAIAEFLHRGGGRFPSHRTDHYVKQFWPDFGMVAAVEQGHPGISDPRAVPPMLELLDRVGPAALVTHSQGGDLGWRLAVAAPEKIAGIVAVEPSRTSPGLDDPAFPDIPVCVIWGDNTPDAGPVLSKIDVDAGRAIAAHRRNVTIDVLPEAGITGNGHMLMMESNNAEIAQRIAGWLRANVRG